MHQARYAWYSSIQAHILQMDSRPSAVTNAHFTDQSSPLRTLNADLAPRLKIKCFNVKHSIQRIHPVITNMLRCQTKVTSEHSKCWLLFFTLSGTQNLQLYKLWIDQISQDLVNDPEKVIKVTFDINFF